MSANDENRKPTNHGTFSINTAIGQNKDTSSNATETSSSQAPSLQSPRAGSQAPPSLDTIAETSGATNLTSPLSGNAAQYTLSQSITTSPTEQEATSSFGSQVISALSNAMGSLGVTQLSNPPADNDPQYAASQSASNQADLAPPGSGRQEPSMNGAHVTLPSWRGRTIEEEVSDISESSSYPSSPVDPQHPLSLNGVDETDFAPPTPVRQFDYSTVPAGLQNIRAQDALHMNQDHGDSSGQPARSSAARGHARQASVDERSDSSGESPCDVCDHPQRSEYMSTFEPKPVRACRNPPLNLNGGQFWNPLTQQSEADVQIPITEETKRMPCLPHERVAGGIGSSSRYSALPPAGGAVLTAPSAAGSYLNLSLNEMLRALRPSDMVGSAIEDSPTSSPDGPPAHTTSNAEASSSANKHVTILSPQRNDLAPLKTTNSYTPGLQSNLTPFPRLSDSSSSNDGPPISPRTHDRFDGQNTAPVPQRAITPTPLLKTDAPSVSEEINASWTPISPTSQPPPEPLGLRAGHAHPADDVLHTNQQEHDSLVRTRTDPQDWVSRHEGSLSLRQTQSAENNSARGRRVTLDENARRKADFDEKWRKEMPINIREKLRGEAHGGKRKGSEVGMHKPLVKFARKHAAMAKEKWLDTTSGKTHAEREAVKAVQEARKLSVEVHGAPAENSRPTVSEIARSPVKSLRRLSSRCFSRAPWERSAIDESTNDVASPAVEDADQAEPGRFSSLTGSMRGSIGNLVTRMKPNFRRSRSEANVLGPTQQNTMDVWRASKEVNRPRRVEQTDASPNLDVQIDSSRLVSPTTTRTTPFDVHPGCLMGCLTINGQAQCAHGRTVPIARTESERRNDPENVPSMLDVMPEVPLNDPVPSRLNEMPAVPSNDPEHAASSLEPMPEVPSMTPDNGTSDESETSSQVEAKYRLAARKWIGE